MGRFPQLRMYSGTVGRLLKAGSAASLMASSSTEYSAVASPVAEVVAGEPDAVEYPEGHWIAQSVWHGEAVGLATAALQHHFRDRDDVLVAMELVVYYERGDKRARLQPDVQVVFDVGRAGNRRTYKVWEEGKAPDFVLEVASPSTAENDARHKASEYAMIGVREYWRLDPEGTMMAAPLEGYRAKGGRYHWVEPVERTGGVEYLISKVLGLGLRAKRRHGATVLVIRDPRTGEEFHGSLEASERQRWIAENRAKAAEEELAIARHEASAAKKRIRLLEQWLGELTGQTRAMGQDS